MGFFSEIVDFITEPITSIATGLIVTGKQIGRAHV